MRVLLFSLFVLLTGCVSTQTNNANTEVEKKFSRVDCKLMSGNPTLENQFQQDTAVCKNRAEAAAISGTTSIPVGQGAVNAAFSGMQRGMAQRDIAMSTALSCMAERGYLYESGSEHSERCQRLGTAQPY